MNRKYLLTLMFMVGYLLSSCNGTKNKINDEKVRDSIGVDLSVKPTQVERKHKDIHFESLSVDSIVGSYRILYKMQDNGQIVNTYPITDEKGKDTIYYASQDVILTINKDGKDIILNRKIQRDDFRSFIPKNEISKYCISNFKITDVTTTGIKFSINFCVPDTDICYWFEWIVSDNGHIKINEVIEKESDM